MSSHAQALPEPSDYTDQRHGGADKHAQKLAATSEKQLQGLLNEVGISSQSSVEHFTNNPSHRLTDGTSLNGDVTANSNAALVNKVTGDQFPGLQIDGANHAPTEPKKEHHSWLKSALSIAGDVAIGAGAVMLAPETGGGSVAAAVGMLGVRGAAMTLAEGAKSELLGEKFDWSPSHLAKSTVMDGALLGVAKYAVPKALGAFGSKAAADTTEQIANAFESNPSTSALSPEAQQKLEERLATSYTKTSLAGAMPKSEIEGVLRGIAPTGSAEFQQAAPLIEENAANHVVTPSDMEGPAERLKGTARLKAVEAGVNVSANLTTKMLLGPFLNGHFDSQDVKKTMTGGGTVMPALQIAKSAVGEAKV